jgi:hypothetical protein
MRTHEMMYVKGSDSFRRKVLFKIRAESLPPHCDELMKLCLKNHIPSLQKKKKFLWEKKTNQK